MHPFSIDFITREPASEVEDYRQCLRLPAYPGEPDKQTTEAFRQTPSPTDSGMESDHSPSQLENTKSIAETLLSLDKRVDVIREDKSDEKPPHSYIALISMAILSQPEKKMLLCDIYQYVMDNFNYYNNDEKAWRNSIRHNLSLNECFVKNGRADNGKGNYWSIHPACEEDFSKGDFRRRQARRRARKSIKDPGSNDLGLSYRYNVGYVPMTASHIGYHPYGAAATSLLYPQQTTTYPTITSAPTTSPAGLTSLPSHLSHNFSQSCLSSPSYLTQPITSSPQNSTLNSPAAAAAAHRFFSEQTSAAFGTQTFSPNHLSSGLQFQNW